MPETPQMRYAIRVAHVWLRRAPGGMAPTKKMNRQLCMMAQPIAVLIIAQPGQFRDGLQTLVKALPQVDCVGLADDSTNLPTTIPLSIVPALVVLDGGFHCQSDLHDLQYVKARWPQARCIVMVEAECNAQEMLATGADVVLVKGVLATRLLTIVEELLSA
jgi:DNA-binding NarL/FixJ family response regulator